ncbi:MAG: hypothetical protein KAG53_11025 [Endozoicomonadaceae bacterium]|nr:hypothetical protein [Endozoicomonadaceae bacterium]
MAIEILTVISSGKINFILNDICGSLSGIVRLIETNYLSKNDNCVKGSLGFLFKCIAKEKSQFRYFQLENILVSINSLVKSWVKEDANIRDIIDVVILLLPYLIPHIKQPNKQQICLFLGVMGNLVDKSLKEKHWHFDEIFEILLCAIPNKSSEFACNHIVIAFQSLSVLLQHRLSRLDELLYRNAIDSLILVLEEKIHHCDAIDICRLIHDIGKIIYYDVDFKLNDLFEKLLDIAPEKISDVDVQYASILLWGIGRVSKKIAFNEKSIDNITKIYYLVDPCVQQNIQNISLINMSLLLWSYGQLIEYKLVQGEPLKLKLSLKSLIGCQLNYLLNVKGNLIDLNANLVSRIIFGMVKMLLYDPYVNKTLVDDFFVKFITLLFGRESEIIIINTCKLISSIGRFVRIGANWTEDVEEFTNRLLDNIIHKETEEIEKIWLSTMLSMLDSLAVIGLRLRNLKVLLRRIMRSNMIDKLTSKKDKSLMLSSLSYFYSWSVSSFYSRYDENEQLKNELGQLMLSLVEQIDRMFLEDESDNYPSIIIRYAKFWLGIYDENININYEVSISNVQKKLLLNLMEKYVYCEITSEVSINNLPPVDIAFLKYMLIIEMDGFHHFLNKKQSIFTGKSIAKMKAYACMGFTVISVPTLAIEFNETLCFLSLYDKIDTHIAKYHPCPY